eukprot:TRINITY_DN11865_c0_g1_i3.p1 TRINITY_DN11865_c0_g1~~TRINITY_DN11865_c0_g1_i3.p1  ORF type:complete len:113 (-),score=23.61 TRINITY_DN11865_c0_g1_i3:296-634(-)
MEASLIVFLLSGVMGRALSCNSVDRQKGSCPRIISRAEWGARPPTEESSHLPDLLPMLFVHHSAMAECEDQESCSKAVRNIQDLHMDGNEWWDIGYRCWVLIDPKVRVINCV